MDISELVTKGGDVAYGVYYEKDKEDSEDSSEDSSSEISSAEDEMDEEASEDSDEEKNFAGDTAAAVEEFYKGDADLQQVVTAFANELPLIPLCYRTGMVSYSTAISGIDPSYGDVYGGLENVKLKDK